MSRVVIDREDRARLRELIASRYPWVTEHDRGPRIVAAGECGACGREPRLLVTCGPDAPATEICRSCAMQAGPEAWCAGHADEAAAHLAWAAALPDDWAMVCRLWWVSTGEVALDPALLARSPTLAALVSRATAHGG